MALITCPECGKPNVSDSAERCPECGYGIREHFTKIEQEQAQKEMGIKDQERKEHEKEKIDKELKALDEELQIKLKEIEDTPRPPKPTILKSTFTGKGSGLSFIALILMIIGLFVFFTSDDKFDKGFTVVGLILPLIWFIICIGSFKTELSSWKDFDSILLVRKANLRTEYKEYANNLKEYGTIVSPKKSYTTTQNTNQLRCPICGSVDVKRISTLNRSASVAMVGLASSKIGKQYQCEKCNHLW